MNWYRSRTNFKGEGMYLQDVLKMSAQADNTIAPDGAPTDQFTETWANSVPLLDLFNNKRKDEWEYIQIAPYNANGVWDAVSNSHAVVIGFYSTLKEWDFEVIQKEVTTLFTAAVHHFVTCIPNSIHEKDGYEWVSVVDSSLYKGYRLRHVRKDFLEKRMFLGAGFYRKILQPAPIVPVAANLSCSYGEKNIAVVRLQKMLLDLGLLDPTSQTGYYGNLTASAVLKWQLANASLFITNPIELTRLAGRYYGKQSVDAAKKLYSK